MPVEPVDESIPEGEQQELTTILGEKAEKLPADNQAKLSRLDPLRRYLLEISQFEPLSPEEERRLAIRYREDEDQDAAYRLVTANLRLVVKVAMIYRSVYFNVMDLIQEGNIGLIEAMKRFDPHKGARLPTYASWWIKAYIIKFILDNFRIVRVGTTNDRRKLLFNLRKEKERLSLQGIEPTPARIAKRLNVSVENVKDIEQNMESSDLRPQHLRQCRSIHSVPGHPQGNGGIGRRAARSRGAPEVVLRQDPGIFADAERARAIHPI